MKDKARLGVVGAGYVGLPTAAGFASLGHRVVCIDSNRDRVEQLRAGRSVIRELGLDELLEPQRRSGRLQFFEDFEALRRSDIVLLSVPTPSLPGTGAVDLEQVRRAVAAVAGAISQPAVLAIKSTVPVGTGDALAEELRRQGSPLAVASFPEFFCEGSAVYDFFHPSRLVVGAEVEWAADAMRELLEPFRDRCPVLVVDRRTAELVKYASNAFLAMKVHYANTVADFCEKTGADVDSVLRAVGLDPRIGGQFLRPGPGFGGSCFPKDIRALIAMGREWGVPLDLVETTLRGNEMRQMALVQRILARLQKISHPRAAVLGLAFKAGTDDCRESPAIAIVEGLLAAGVTVAVSDPLAMEGARRLLGERVLHAANALAAARGSDVLVIGTENFPDLDLEGIRPAMRTAQIVDLRNAVAAERAAELGFYYEGIGRPALATIPLPVSHPGAGEGECAPLPQGRTRTGTTTR
ncbi:MAG: UDP-glucose/GDP-mannose dehydrogenase family protein [Puniceicoccales bacterium]|jgi:UDPglucose 6-dehydrogenase|nr:UDP-glucose/GDP-mannose dehydrogenase family protein [Puniceicoccales bacterium]